METILESVRSLFFSKIHIKTSAGDENPSFAEKCYTCWVLLSGTDYEVDQSLGSDVKNKLKSYSFQDAVSKLLIKADRSTEWTFFPQLSSTLTSLERELRMYESDKGKDESENEKLLEIRTCLETINLNADVDFFLSKKNLCMYAAVIYTLVDQIMYFSEEPLASIIFGYTQLVNLWFEVQLRKKFAGMK